MGKSTVSKEKNIFIVSFSFLSTYKIDLAKPLLFHTKAVRHSLKMNFTKVDCATFN